MFIKFKFKVLKSYKCYYIHKNQVTSGDGQRVTEGKKVLKR